MRKRGCLSSAKMTTSFRSTTPPPGAHRLSLKDMDLVPSPRSSTTTSRGKITESHAMSADGKRGCGAGVERKRRTVTEGSGGGGGGVARRGSLTLMANQLRRLEAGENSTKYHRYFEREGVSVTQVVASPEEGCATVSGICCKRLSHRCSFGAVLHMR